jgi:hypothetical protein
LTGEVPRLPRMIEESWFFEDSRLLPSGREIVMLVLGLVERVQIQPHGELL